MRAARSIARTAAVLATAAALALPGRADAQGTSGVIGVSAYVMPATRPDTIPEARAPQWRSTVPVDEPVLVRGTLVRDTLLADDRRRLVLAYVGN